MATYAPTIFCSWHHAQTQIVARHLLLCTPGACFTKRSDIYELKYLVNSYYTYKAMPADIRTILICELICVCSIQARTLLVKQASDIFNIFCLFLFSFIQNCVHHPEVTNMHVLCVYHVLITISIWGYGIVLGVNRAII